MFRRTITVTLAAAAPLIAAGCASSPASAPTPEDSRARLVELQESGSLPVELPERLDGLRVEVAGQEFGILWRGEAITQDCAPAEGTPNKTAARMLLQDVGLTEVQQCRGIYQAVQADGSRVAWN